MNRCAAVPYEGSENYIFISYSHRDTAIVLPILELFQQAGYRLWYDEGIDPGSEWPEYIASHLSGASACIGFLSANYLASVNCRREMNFALKKQIPYLSVLLEPVEMSAGVEMQLSANQAVFKYLLPSDELFLRKINSTTLLQSSRALPAPVSEEAPAPVETPIAVPSAQAPAAPPEPPSAEIKKEAPKRERKARPAAEAPDKPPKAEPRRGGGKKALRIVLIALAAVVALIVIAVIVTSGKSGRRSAPSPTPQQTAVEGKYEDLPLDTDIMLVPDSPVSKDRLLVRSPFAGRVLWGRKTESRYGDAEAFIKGIPFADVSLSRGVTNLSALPYAMEARRDDHPELVRLTFLDKVGTEYVVQGAYTILDGQLTVSPCEPAFDDALTLEETLTYTVSLYYDQLKLGSDGLSFTVNYRSDDAAVRGSADNAVFQELGAIEITEFTEGAACAVQFADGGSAKDAVVAQVWDSIASVKLTWTQEERPYNGSMADFEANGRCSFYYFNTAPYGFLLIDGTDLYFYQEPYPSDAD